MDQTSTISHSRDSGLFRALAALIVAMFSSLAMGAGIPTRVFLEQGGQVVIEAEQWSEVDSGSWRTANAYRDASGGGYLVSAGTFESRGKVTYAIRFETTDTFFVFLRTWANDPGDNGCFLTLDGKKFGNPGSNEGVYFHKRMQWDWRTRVLCGDGCHHETPFFVIDTPGVHLLGIGVRELGATIDRIVLRTFDTTPQDSLPAQASADTGYATTQPGKSVWLWAAIAAAAVFLIGGAIVIGRLRHAKHHEPSAMTPCSATLPSPVRRAVEVMAARYAEELSLAELAREACVSPGYLGKLFKESTGKTVLEYLNDYRLEQAVALMRSTELNVSEIQHRVGIHHPSYFARVFKRRTGKTPSEFIQSARQ